jgi:transposase InsO family protein
MSRKAKSEDNAPVEGVNGKIKREFFNHDDFTGLSTKQFMREIDKFIIWYNSERIFNSLNGMTIPEHRKMARFAELKKVC